MPIKLLTLNIEGEAHLNKVRELLGDEKPDVSCLQHVTPQGFDQIKTNLCLRGKYFPMNDAGVAYLTNLPNQGISGQYYYRAGDSTQEGDIDRVFVHAVVNNGDAYSIGTTHFYWTPDGKPNECQLMALESLSSITDSLDDLVLCGDLNVPRGNMIYRRLTERFRDNIPIDVDSTLDPKIHRNPDLKFVVDYIFTTPPYQVLDIKVVSGVSDHKAIVGIIHRLAERRSR